jgi:DNA-binding NarL/FixJ family response regulator
MAEDRLRELAIELLGSVAAESSSPHWEDLFAGEWKLLDQFDREGHRYVIARRRRRPIEAELEASEWDALRLRASGASLKVIADQLQVSLPTASRRIKSGMKKLGIRTGSDLAKLLGR